MAQQLINIGSSPNDGTGDPLRDAMTKTNDNFTELYAVDVLATGATTGVLTGGVLSTGAGAAEFSISDGTGQIIDNLGNKTLVSWTGITNITPTNIATQNITFVAINSSGNLLESSVKFTNQDHRLYVVLGVIVHVNRTTVDAVNQEQHISFNTGSQQFDLLNALGFFNDEGNVFSSSGADLTIDKTVGKIYLQGSNYDIDINNPNNKTLPVLTDVSFQYRFSDGSNGTTGTILDPDNLDDGAGGLTAVGNNRWSIQRIYSFPSNNVKIQRGVADYASKNAALAAIDSEAFIKETSIDANGLLRCFLVVKKGATDLSNTTEAIFVEAPKIQGGSSAGGISGGTSLQGAYDNSGANPEIQTNDTNGALSFRRGSTGGDSDNVIAVQNNAGTDTFIVDGNGNTIVNELTTSDVLIDETTGFIFNKNYLDRDFVVRKITSGNALKYDAGTDAITSDSPIEQNDTTASTSTTTGSIQTAGGLGVEGDVFIGGKVDIETSTFPAYSAKALTTSTAGAATTTIFHRETSNDMADGFGLNFQFRISDDTSSDNIIGRVEAVRSGADNKGTLIFRAGTNGATDYIECRGDENDIIFNKPLVRTPSSSITPANNGELVVEKTSNTTLTFKLKGSDGVVRTGTMTLS